MTASTILRRVLFVALIALIAIATTPAAAHSSGAVNRYAALANANAQRDSRIQIDERDLDERDDDDDDDEDCDDDEDEDDNKRVKVNVKADAKKKDSKKHTKSKSKSHKTKTQTSKLSSTPVAAATGADSGAADTPSATGLAGNNAVAMQATVPTANGALSFGPSFAAVGVTAAASVVMGALLL